jgi:hypothetical protein
MKIRTGFVSNSSSSSFVIGKYFMTLEQIKKFSELNKKFDEASVLNYDDDPIEYDGWVIMPNDETYIYEDDKYFFGSISNEHYEVMYDFMQKNNLRTKYSVGD